MTALRSPVRGERLYRALLELYPLAFRQRYADDMVAFYRERVTLDAPHLRGLAAIWAPLLPDLLASAFAERIGSATSRRQPNGGFTPSPTLQREESMSVLQQDVRFALRGMSHRPAFTAIVLATLALGIGANTAIFSVVDAVLLRPLPFAAVDRLVDFAHQDPYWSVSEPEFLDYRRDVKAFEKLAAYNTEDVTLAVGDEPMRSVGTRVSTAYFDILGVRPVLGRTFAPDEYSHLAKGRIVVISHALWQQQFAGDAHIVGRAVEINGNPSTIIGVMPAGFAFPNAQTTFWYPWRLNPDSVWTRNNHYLRLVGKLAPGATVEHARSQVRTLNQRWVRQFPETYFPTQPPVGVITPLRDFVLGATRPYLLALLGAVVFILLIACVNVANLLLVRGDARRKEFAIRTALGASRSRVVRQLLTESMLYAIIGGALGIGIAWFGTRGLILLAPTDVPRLDQVGVDYRVVAFTIGVTLFTGVLFGLAPAMRGMRGESAQTLRDGGKTSAHRASRLARRGLVVTEVALAVIMLSGAGLLTRSLLRLQAVELGFEPEHVLTMRVTLPARRYSDTTADAFFRQLVDRVSNLPGVKSAAVDGALPISGDESMWSILVDGRVVKTIAEAPSAKPSQVSAGYFRTLSIPLRRGRFFTNADVMGAPPVAIVNEAMAKTLWPGVDPIGHTIKMFNPKSPWVTVVGVVGDIRSRGIQQDIPPTMYFPHSQSGLSAYYMPRSMTLVARAAGDSRALAGTVRTVIRGLDSRVPISEVATLDDVVAQSIASRRFTTILLGGFAALALALAGIGIYGVIAYGVSQRTYEIGVRLALGASTASVARLVVSEGVRMTTAGLALGLAGALAVDRLLRSLLVGVTTTDLPTLAGVIAVLTAVSVIACALPARRATAVSPTEALRNG